MSGARNTRETLAGGLKFVSAVCALAAAVLLAHPLIVEEGSGARPPREPPRPSAPVARAPEGPEGSDVEVTVAEESPPEPTPELPPTPTPEPTRGGIQEERAHFKSSLLALESRPAGASVRVDGVDQGETPVTVGMECAPGKRLRIEFSLSGFASKIHEIPCPRDAMVTVTARLKPNARGGKGKR